MRLDKFKGKLREKDKTYEDCAKVLHRSIGYICCKLNGRGSFPIDELEILGNYLEMTQTEKAEIFLG